MIKRGLVVAPLLVAVCGVIWGGDGAWSALYGIALVLANFALAAGLIAMTIRISLGADAWPPCCSATSSASG